MVRFRQKVDKNNKKLKNLDTDLLTRRFTFELAQTHWATHKGVWCAIDFESWERHHPDVTEIGYSYIHWNASGEEVRVNKHLIVRENRHLRNGQYVKDHRYVRCSVKQFLSGKMLTPTLLSELQLRYQRGDWEERVRQSCVLTDLGGVTHARPCFPSLS